MDERKTSREVVDLEVDATHCGRSIQVDVYEMSVAGCMVASRDNSPLEAGAAITLCLGPLGTVDGVLIWAKGKVAGVQFDAVLDGSAVRELHPSRATEFDTRFRDRFGRPLAALQRRFTDRSLQGSEETRT